MQNLIDLVRGLIGDTDSVDKAFTNAEIEAILTQYSERVIYQPLAGSLVKIGAAWEQREFQAAVGFWANGAQLFDTQYQRIFPATSDLIAGRWLFDNHQECIYLTGTTCDVYAAAADLLALWAGRVGYEKNGRGQALNEAAKEMRRRMRPRILTDD